MLMDVELGGLPNGVRVASAAVTSVDSVSLGVWMGVGGRHESRAASGASHFLEHLVFKGTRSFSAREISQAIEGRGGYLNAFTQEESTCYYVRVAREHLDVALDVLAEMVLRPKLAADDVERERDVIVEEILMYRDQPQHLVEEMLGELLWKDHPLGRPLTGTPESLRRLDRKAMKGFMARHYVPANTRIVFAGAVDHRACMEAVARRWGRMQGPKPRPEAPVERRTPQGRNDLVSKDSEQVHLTLGFRLFGRHDRRRYALKLLSVVLGENMSSRLFQRIREDEGLAYAIQTGTHLYSDSGALILSAGLDRKRLGRAVRLAVAELGRVRRQRVPEAELRRAKDYATGQLRLGLEGTSGQMMWVGENLLAYGRHVTPEEAIREVEAVTADEVQAVAAQCLGAARSSLAVIGPDLKEREKSELLGTVAKLG